MDETQNVTLALQKNMEDFWKDFRSEYKNQEKRINIASERRMRKLLLSFRDRVYIPYREGTLRRDEKESK